MILKPTNVISVLTAAVVFSLCAAHAGTAPEDRASKAVAAAPTADALLALDQQATAAYIRGDAKFFESILSDNFVTRQGGARLGKTDTIKMISGLKCDVKEGWRLTEPQLSKIDSDTYALIYRANVEGGCTVDSKTETLPSPVRAATVWVRNGERWQAAFHGENLIVDTTTAPAADKQAESKKDEKATAGGHTTTAPAPRNALTDTLMAAERSAWEAWKTKDAKTIEQLTAREIAFVNLFGTSFGNKADTIKDWTGAACQVTGFTLTDGVASAVSPTVGILTLTGTVTGNCSGQDISGQKIHANTVYTKEGDAWKWAFGFNSP